MLLLERFQLGMDPRQLHDVAIRILLVEREPIFKALPTDLVALLFERALHLEFLRSRQQAEFLLQLRVLLLERNLRELRCPGRLDADVVDLLQLLGGLAPRLDDGLLRGLVFLAVLAVPLRDQQRLLIEDADTRIAVVLVCGFLRLQRLQLGRVVVLVHRQLGLGDLSAHRQVVGRAGRRERELRPPERQLRGLAELLERSLLVLHLLERELLLVELGLPLAGLARVLLLLGLVVHALVAALRLANRSALVPGAREVVRKRVRGLVESVLGCIDDVVDAGRVPILHLLPDVRGAGEVAAEHLGQQL